MKHLGGISYAQTAASQAAVEEGGEKIAKRNTYLYTIRERRKIVQYGITDNPDRRAIEHNGSRKRFTSIIVDPYPRTRESAKNEETRRIQTYQKTHKGRKPRYNKIC
jgi:predicted GIY-YIG superfamily endonuclease